MLRTSKEKLVMPEADQPLAENCPVRAHCPLNISGEFLAFAKPPFSMVNNFSMGKVVKLQYRRLAHALFWLHWMWVFLVVFGMIIHVSALAYPALAWYQPVHLTVLLITLIGLLPRNGECILAKWENEMFKKYDPSMMYQGSFQEVVGESLGLLPEAAKSIDQITFEKLAIIGRDYFI